MRCVRLFSKFSNLEISLDTAILTSGSTLILARQLLVFTANAENSVSQRYDVSNWIWVCWALALSSGYSSFLISKTQCLSCCKDFVFKLLSQYSSVRFSFSLRVNSDGTLAVNGIRIHTNLSKSSGKYFKKQSLNVSGVFRKQVQVRGSNQLHSM